MHRKPLTIDSRWKGPRSAPGESALRQSGSIYICETAATEAVRLEADKNREVANARCIRSESAGTGRAPGALLTAVRVVGRLCQTPLVADRRLAQTPYNPQFERYFFSKSGRYAS